MLAVGAAGADVVMPPELSGPWAPGRCPRPSWVLVLLAGSPPPCSVLPMGGHLRLLGTVGGLQVQSQRCQTCFTPSEMRVQSRRPWGCFVKANSVRPQKTNDSTEPGAPPPAETPGAVLSPARLSLPPWPRRMSDLEVQWERDSPLTVSLRKPDARPLRVVTLGSPSAVVLTLRSPDPSCPQAVGFQCSQDVGWGLRTLSQAVPCFSPCARARRAPQAAGSEDQAARDGASRGLSFLGLRGPCGW